jgi:hypothetical protein
MIQLYKPNARNEGCAFGFREGLNNDRDREPCVYVTAIKQHSWNSKTRNGSFSENKDNPDKKIQIKLNENELGGFIAAVDRYKEFSAFHSFEDTKTSITFKPYTKKTGGEQAFSLTFTRNSAEKFGIGVEIGEAYLMAEYFRYVLRKLFHQRAVKQEEYRKKPKENE